MAKFIQDEKFLQIRRNEDELRAIVNPKKYSREEQLKQLDTLKRSQESNALRAELIGDDE